MAATMPAWCPTCEKLVEPNIGVVINEFIQLTVERMDSQCSECGGLAFGVEGTFAICDEMIQVIEASQWTHQQLADFQKTLEWASQNLETQADVAIQKIAEHSPKVASLTRRMLLKHGVKIASGGLAVMATVVLTPLADRAVDSVWPKDKPIIVQPAAPTVIVVNDGTKEPQPHSDERPGYPRGFPPKASSATEQEPRSGGTTGPLPPVRATESPW